jgi:hypothetical protein
MKNLPTCHVANSGALEEEATVQGAGMFKTPSANKQQNQQAGSMTRRSSRKLQFRSSSWPEGFSG